jgi:phosphoribosylamine---glycine ligase
MPGAAMMPGEGSNVVSNDSLTRCSTSSAAFTRAHGKATGAADGRAPDLAVRGPARGRLMLSRLVALGLAAGGAGMLPWLVYLAVSLPPSAVAWHWPAAWVGLDAMEAAGLTCTGVLMLRRDARYCLTATATAMLLITDAWFDVTTASPGAAELESLLMAALAEVPTAALCAWLARRGLRTLAGGQPSRGRRPARAAESAEAGRVVADTAGRLGAVRVLVIGSGGREHALALALSRDPAVTQLHAAPGNPGIAQLAELHSVAPADPVQVIALARQIASDLIVIGPEAPLVAGVAEALRAAGFRCFGPDQRPAMIEGSKSFAKQVMTAAGVPTASARTCTGMAEVQAALDAFGPPYVVKADGLAAGKGVVVTTDRGEALEHAAACGTVVIEEFLDGPEVSVFAIADGSTAVTLLPAQDYKRAFDGNAGPNTGGMGAYAPLAWAPAGLAEETLAAVVQPTLAELARRGTPYSGLLYAGLCLTPGGIRVVEFNARFGDPETQVVLDRLATPLGGLLSAAAAGDLAGAGKLTWLPGAAVTVVIAAEGYPAAPVGGDQIDGIDDAQHVPGSYVLHAGTARDSSGRLVASGGRVLNVVAAGSDQTGARASAYEAAARIRMRGSWYRRDIAAEPAPGTRTGT